MSCAHLSPECRHAGWARQGRTSPGPARTPAGQRPLDVVLRGHGASAAAAATAHTPVSGPWPGQLARTALSRRERSQRCRGSPKEKSSAANPLALAYSPAHKSCFPPRCAPRTREQSEAPVHLPPCQAGRGGTGPWAHRGPPAWRPLAFAWIKGTGSCRQVLPATLTSRQGERQS